MGFARHGRLISLHQSLLPCQFSCYSEEHILLQIITSSNFWPVVWISPNFLFQVYFIFNCKGVKTKIYQVYEECWNLVWKLFVHLRCIWGVHTSGVRILLSLPRRRWWKYSGGVARLHQNDWGFPFDGFLQIEETVAILSSDPSRREEFDDDMIWGRNRRDDVPRRGKERQAARRCKVL